MEIALAILHADAARGGAERYTIDLAAALARRGHDVQVIATSIGRLPLDVRGVQLMSRRPLRSWSYAAYLRLLDGHLRRNPVDIVHAMLPVRRCDIYHPHAGIAAATIKTDAAIARLSNPRRGMMARTERKLIDGRLKPIILSLSDYVRGSIVAEYPAAADRIEVLFNAVDLDRFQPRPSPAHGDEVHGLMIAQDFARKGLAEAIEAMKQCDDPWLHLTIVGGDDPRAYRALAERMGVGARVKFAGRTDDPRPYYQAADFFLLPTHHDPCSLVVLEALAMGVPVITTRFNGAAEIMTDGTHGFVVPTPTDIPQLSHAIKQVCDAHRRAQMSNACVALRPRLSYDAHIDRLLAIYQRRRDGSTPLAGSAT